MADTFSLNLNKVGTNFVSGAISISNGQPFMLTGSGFGTKVGYSDHFNLSGVYNQALGSNFAAVGRWNGSSYLSAGNRFQVVNEGINGRCLKAHQNANSTPNNTLTWNGDDYLPLNRKWRSSLYVKHYSSAILGGQWKYGRWQRSTSSLSDKPNENYWNARNNPPANDNKCQIRNSLGVGGAGDFTQYVSNDITKMPHQKNKWFRMDLLHTMATAYDQPQTFMCEGWVYDPDGLVAPTYYNFTPNQAVELVNPYNQAGTEWIQHMYQNYLGSGGSEGDFTDYAHDLWHDKMFESYGDDKRIEFSDNPSWPSRKKSFVQPLNYIDHATPWTDTAVYGVADTGDLSFGYLLIMDGSTVIKSIPARVA